MITRCFLLVDGIMKNIINIIISINSKKASTRMCLISKLLFLNI